MRIDARHLATLAWLTLALAASAACQHKDIPQRPPPREDPTKLLSGGKLVFEDGFERAALGADWKTTHAGWVIEGGWAHSTNPRNAGLWLTRPLPDKARIEFDARSEPLPGGKPFPGDLKCEVFATAPQHQAGYILVNGGWKNSLDIVARLDEHGKDRKERASQAVEPSKTYRWAVARTGSTIHWFRDGAPFMTYDDDAPIAGRFFGFNNWEANVYFDNVKVFDLNQ